MLVRLLITIVMMSLIASSACLREAPTLKHGSVDVCIEPGVGVKTVCAIGMTAEEILENTPCAIASGDSTLISLTNIGVVAYMSFQCEEGNAICYGVAFKIAISKYDDSECPTTYYRGGVTGIDKGNEISWRDVILAFGAPERELINSDYFDFKTSCVHYFDLPKKPRKKIVYPASGISFAGDFDSNGPDEVFVFNPVVPVVASPAWKMGR